MTARDSMVAILDGNSRCALMKEKNSYITFATAVDLNKCHKQINLTISPYTCAPISELPSDISIMDQIRFTSERSKFIYSLREATKKFFFSGPATKALTPQPPRA